MNSKQQIYEFLTNPKNFSTAISLIDSLEEVKQKLTSEFWERVADEIKSDKRVAKWKVVIDDYDEPRGISISLIHPDDTESRIYYAISIESNGKMSYGIGIDSDKINPTKQKLIFEESKSFKQDQWKLNKYESGYPWPIYYYFDNWNFNDNNIIKSILPSTRDLTIKEIVDQFLGDFTIKIQNFILRHLRANNVIK